MSQAEVEAMTAQKQQQMKVDQSGAASDNDDKSNTNGSNATTDAANAENVGINGEKAANAVPASIVDDENAKSQQTTPNQQPQHQQNQMHHYNGPPPHFGPQFGMPPPGYGNYPPGPWGMPWQHPPQQQQMSEPPAKNLIVKPGVIEPQVIARAAEWSEHRAPDGRPYYYHSGRGESVWEKPQAIRDLEGKKSKF